MPLSDLDTPEEGEDDEAPQNAPINSMMPASPSASMAQPALDEDSASRTAPPEAEDDDEEEFGLPSHVLAIALGDLDSETPLEGSDPPSHTTTPLPVVLGAVHSLSQDPDLFSEIEVEEEDWSCLEEEPPRLSASFHHPNVSQDPVGKEILIREAVLEDQRMKCLRLELPKIDDLAHVNSRGRVDLKVLKRTQPQLFCRRPAKKTAKAKKPRAPRKPRPASKKAKTAAKPAKPALVQYSSSDSDDSELEELRKKHRQVAPITPKVTPNALKRDRTSSQPDSEPEKPRSKQVKSETGVITLMRSPKPVPPKSVVSDSDDSEPVAKKVVVSDSDDPEVKTQPISPPSSPKAEIATSIPSPSESKPTTSAVETPPRQVQIEDESSWNETGPLNLAFFDSTHDLRKFKKLLLVELHHHCEFLGKKAAGISFSALELRIQTALDRIKAQEPLIQARPVAKIPRSELEKTLRARADIQRDVHIQLRDVKSPASEHEKAFQNAWPHFEKTLERRNRQRQEALSFCLKMVKKFLDTRELYSRAKKESEEKRKDRKSRNRKIHSDDSESNDEEDKAKSKSTSSKRKSSPDLRTKSDTLVTQMGKGFKIPKAEGKTKDISKEASMKSILKEEPSKVNNKVPPVNNAKHLASKQYNHSYQKTRDPSQTNSYNKGSRPNANKKPTFSSSLTSSKETQSFDLLNVVSGMKNIAKKKEPRIDPRVKELQSRALSKNEQQEDCSANKNRHKVNGKSASSLSNDKANRITLYAIGDEEVDEILSRRMRDPKGQDFSTVIAWREPGLNLIQFKCRVCNLHIEGKEELSHHVVGFRHHTNSKRHTALPPRDIPKVAPDKLSSPLGNGSPMGDDDRDDSPTHGANAQQPPVMNFRPVPSLVPGMPKFSLPLPVPSLPKPVPLTRPGNGLVPQTTLTSSVPPMQTSVEPSRPRAIIPGLPTPIPVPGVMPSSDATPCPVPQPSGVPSPKQPGSPVVKSGLSMADLEKLPPPMKMSERVKNHLSSTQPHAMVNPLQEDRAFQPKEALVHSSTTPSEIKDVGEEGEDKDEEKPTNPLEKQKEPKEDDAPEGGYYEPGEQTPLWNPPSAAASEKTKGSEGHASESFGEFNINPTKSFLDKNNPSESDTLALSVQNKIQVKDVNTLTKPTESESTKAMGQDFSSILNQVINTLAKSKKAPIDAVPTPPPPSDPPQPPPPPLPVTETAPAPPLPISEPSEGELVSNPVALLADSNVRQILLAQDPRLSAEDRAAQTRNQLSNYLGAKNPADPSPLISSQSSTPLCTNFAEGAPVPNPPQNAPKDVKQSSGGISDGEIDTFISQWCHQAPAQPTTSTESVAPTAAAHKEPVLSSALAKLRARKAQKKGTQVEVSSSTGGRCSPQGSDISESSNASGQNFLAGKQYIHHQYHPHPPLPPPPMSHYPQHHPQPYVYPQQPEIGNGWMGTRPPLPPLPPSSISIPPHPPNHHQFPSHYQHPPLPSGQQMYWPR